MLHLLQNRLISDLGQFTARDMNRVTSLTSAVLMQLILSIYWVHVHQDLLISCNFFLVQIYS